MCAASPPPLPPLWWPFCTDVVWKCGILLLLQYQQFPVCLSWKRLFVIQKVIYNAAPVWQSQFWKYKGWGSLRRWELIFRHILSASVKRTASVISLFDTSKIPQVEPCWIFKGNWNYNSFGIVCSSLLSLLLHYSAVPSGFFCPSANLLQLALYCVYSSLVSGLFS